MLQNNLFCEEDIEVLLQDEKSLTKVYKGNSSSGQFFGSFIYEVMYLQ